MGAEKGKGREPRQAPAEAASRQVLGGGAPHSANDVEKDNKKSKLNKRRHRGKETDCEQGEGFRGLRRNLRKGEGRVRKAPSSRGRPYCLAQKGKINNQGEQEGSDRIGWCPVNRVSISLKFEGFKKREPRNEGREQKGHSRLRR